MKVRPATLDDLPVLLEFEQGIIAAERPYDPLLKPDPISYYDIGEMIEADDAEVMVVEIGGELVASGYAKTRRSRHYTSPDWHAFLGFMFVKEGFRGRGLNRVLLDALLGWARRHDLTEVRLTVYPGNEPAIRAYEKAGFSPYLTEMRLGLDD
ncbi:GNAT family N-acetyltransferase [Henriciella aquimarina]|uniref:GNAT family N-acetyltransferase n=1 Tax=Henriciella aquimarina TaxID=545261 RepID=UPI0009FE163A|nr:GNAT family N-acetyltransferase [Henriciella aquimarina]